MDTLQQPSWKILLIGDHCLDIYHYGVCERLSPEAPVPVLKVSNSETKPGMSSNVNLNLKAFGLKVNHQKSPDKIKKHRLIDTRFQHHLIRFDEGEEHLTNEINIKRLESIKNIDAVVISDYNKGFLRYKTINQICDMFKDYPIFVDTKKTNLSCFSNCYIKVNEKEFKSVNKMPKDSEFVVTLGEKGALYKNKTYPVKNTEVFDVCGAGDVFLSALVYGYLKHKSIELAILIANKCAAFSVTKMGTYTLTKEDLNDLCI
jgi:D-beta-D-heptose 7-phosphate kinase/D-beta-D-heptose 1-phosphate adenosyltransferase